MIFPIIPCQEELKNIVTVHYHTGMDNAHALLALLPPGNIEALLASAKTVLFHKLGLASARSMPVHIPLFWHDGASHTRALSECAHGGLRALKADHLEVYENVVMLALEDTSPVRKIRDMLRPQFQERAGPLPPVDGYVLSLTESREPKQIMAALGSLPEVQVSQFWLSDMRVRTTTEPWWNAVSWQVDQEFRMRKNRNG